MKVVFFDDWESPVERLKGTMDILRQLASLAKPAKAA
jgi:transcription-repair coupling factor (superfamily II helicase)